MCGKALDLIAVYRSFPPVGPISPAPSVRRSAPPPKRPPVRCAPIAGRCCIPAVGPRRPWRSRPIGWISRPRSSRLRVKKKRRPGLYRAVPVPAALLDALDLVHGLRDRATRTYLWTWSLKTAYTRVIEIMARAGIAGPQASPKGLAAWFWRGLYRKRDSPQSRAALAGPCAALHDSDLCRRGGRRRAPYCRPPLELTRGNLMGQILSWQPAAPGDGQRAGKRALTA